jgi:hypothetical protein
VDHELSSERLGQTPALLLRLSVPSTPRDRASNVGPLRPHRAILDELREAALSRVLRAGCYAVTLGHARDWSAVLVVLGSDLSAIRDGLDRLLLHDDDSALLAWLREPGPTPPSTGSRDWDLRPV